MGGAAPGPGLRLIDQPVHRTNRTKSYGARNRPTETVGGFGPEISNSSVSRPRLPAVSRPNAPEPRRFRRVRSRTPVCWKAAGGAEGNRTPDLDIANVAIQSTMFIWLGQLRLQNRGLAWHFEVPPVLNGPAQSREIGAHFHRNYTQSVAAWGTKAGGYHGGWRCLGALGARPWLSRAPMFALCSL